jgi:glycosyltransferase involved in cell wall biosynthesis
MEARRRARVTRPLSCSIIVPCRNEEENVDAVVRRVGAILAWPPARLGTHTELIFVDGASTDRTVERIEALIAAHPERDIKLLHQRGHGGKAGAVFQGFDAAQGDVLMILDADLTVAPEDLPRFYLALAEDVTDFANGTRFTYPMEAEAMPDLNKLGNRVFGLFLSWTTGTRIGDTLCGTKALLRNDWPAIAAARPLFGGHDPWGDFDLLLGAAYAGLRILDVPVRYHARTAGESKMRPFQHGVALGRTCLAGVRSLKGRHQGTAPTDRRREPSMHASQRETRSHPGRR